MLSAMGLKTPLLFSNKDGFGINNKQAKKSNQTDILFFSQHEFLMKIFYNKKNTFQFLLFAPNYLTKTLEIFRKKTKHHKILQSSVEQK